LTYEVVGKNKTSGQGESDSRMVGDGIEDKYCGEADQRSSQRRIDNILVQEVEFSQKQNTDYFRED